MAEAKGTNVGSPINTFNEDDTYPTHFDKKGRGGYKPLESLTELLNFPIARMEAGMRVVVAEDLTHNVPETEYRLKSLPYENNSTPSEIVKQHPEPANVDDYTIQTPLTRQNFLDYWQVTRTADNFSGSQEVKYSQDYSGNYYNTLSAQRRKYLDTSKSPFPYSKDTDWDPANGTNWDDVFDDSKHTWKAVKYGNSGWSAPIPLDDLEAIKFGYIQNRYQWTTGSEPNTPDFMIDDGNGNLVRNNTPSGWTDGVPSQGSATHLWKIVASKNLFGELREPWSGPFRVEINGQTKRYSESGTPHPSNVQISSSDVDWTTTSAASGTNGDTALSNEGWDVVPSENHSYIAYRKDNGDGTYTEWSVKRIKDESGEYQDRRFKNFAVNKTQDILNNPENYKPNSPNPSDWTDAPEPKKAKDEGKRVWQIEATKRFDGSLKTDWSDPVPYDGEAIILSVITTDNGNDFKFDPNDETYDVSEIVLTANLYEGDKQLNAGSDIDYTWKRIYNNATTEDTSITSTNSSDNAYLTDSGRKLHIKPADVTGKAIYESSQVLNDSDGNPIDTYKDTQEILDVADGLNALDVDIHAESGYFVYKNGSYQTSQIRLEAFTMNVPSPTYTWEYTTVQNPTSGDWTAITGETASVFNLASADFETQRSTSDFVKYRVKVPNPKPSVSDPLTDIVKIQRTVIEDGQASIIMVLSNQFQTVNTEPDGTLIGSASDHKTTVQIIEGNSDVTSEYENLTATIQSQTNDGGGDNTLTVSASTSPYEVTVDAWGTSVREGIIQITAEDTTASKPTLSRTWTLSRVKGLEDLYVADLDLPNGTTFTTNDTSDKTVTLNLYKNGILEKDTASELESGDYWIKWTNENNDTVIEEGNNSDGSNRSAVISNSDVTNSTTIKVEVFDNSSGDGDSGQLYASRTVDFVDIPDAADIQILYKIATSKPSKPSGSYSSFSGNDPFNSRNVWFQTGTSYPSLNDNERLWRSEKSSKDGTNAWSDPTGVTGEKGAAGQNGGSSRLYFVKVPKETTFISSWDASFSNSNNTDIGSEFLWLTGASNGTYTIYEEPPPYDFATERIWANKLFVHINPDGTFTSGNWGTPFPFSGEQSTDGEDGTTWFSTSGGFASGAVDGDFNIREDRNYKYYKRSGGNWVHQGKFQGEKGDPGDDGVWNASDFWEGGSIERTGSDSNHSWALKFRKSNSGVVYWMVRFYTATNVGDSYEAIFLSTNRSKWAPDQMSSPSTHVANVTVDGITMEILMGLPMSSPFFSNGGFGSASQEFEQPGCWLTRRVGSSSLYVVFHANDGRGAHGGGIYFT